MVIVTGASSGIGRATAQAFARWNGSLVLVARHPTPLRAAVEECERTGGRAVAVSADVADPEAMERAARTAVERFGRLDVWVNNAGVVVYGPFLDTPLEVLRGVIRTNVIGQLTGSRAALEVFREQGRGVVVNVCSLWGHVASPYVSAYAASKFAIRGFSECIRQELALAGASDIHLCTVFPGSVDTPIFRHAANFTGREAPPIPPVADRRRREAILSCVERPRPEVLVGHGTRILVLMRSLFPGLVRRLVPRAFVASALGRRGVGETAGTCSNLRPELNAIRGDWK